MTSHTVDGRLCLILSVTVGVCVAPNITLFFFVSMKTAMRPTAMAPPIIRWFFWTGRPPPPTATATATTTRHRSSPPAALASPPPPAVTRRLHPDHHRRWNLGWPQLRPRRRPRPPDQAETGPMPGGNDRLTVGTDRWPGAWPLAANCLSRFCRITMNTRDQRSNHRRRDTELARGSGCVASRLRNVASSGPCGSFFFSSDLTHDLALSALGRRRRPALASVPRESCSRGDSPTS